MVKKLPQVISESSFKDLITMSNHSLDLESQKMSTLKLMNESPAQRRIKSNFDEFKDVGHGIIKPIQSLESTVAGLKKVVNYNMQRTPINLRRKREVRKEIASKNNSTAGKSSQSSIVDASEFYTANKESKN